MTTPPRTVDRAAPVERGQSRLARARHDLRLDHRRQLVHELLHDFLKIRTSWHLFPPVIGGAQTSFKLRRSQCLILVFRVSRTRVSDDRSFRCVHWRCVRFAGRDSLLPLGCDSRAIRTGRRPGARCSGGSSSLAAVGMPVGGDPRERQDAHRGRTDRDLVRVHLVGRHVSVVYRGVGRPTSARLVVGIARRISGSGGVDADTTNVHCAIDGNGDRGGRHPALTRRRRPVGAAAGGGPPRPRAARAAAARAARTDDRPDHRSPRRADDRARRRRGHRQPHQRARA